MPNSLDRLRMAAALGAAAMVLAAPSTHAQDLIPVPYPEQLGPNAARIPVHPRRHGLQPLPYPQQLGPDAARIPTHSRRHGRLASPYPRQTHPLPDDRPTLPSGQYTMTVTKPVDGQAATPDTRPGLARPVDIPRFLVACWTPPSDSPEGTQGTVRVQFTRDGAVIGTPQITYLKPAQNTDAARQALSQSLRDAISGCTPLRFTGGLGSAIAGVPFAIRFVVRRRNPGSRDI